MKVKDEFLFRTVHGLRSPSVSIRFIAEKYTLPALRDRYPEIREDINLVRGLAVRMLKLIRDLLEAAQGDRPDFTLKLEPVQLTPIVNGIIAEQQVSAQQKQVRFIYQSQADAPRVLADKGRLEEVLGNFIENAVKYNRPAGEIEITHKLRDRRLETLVRNTAAIRPTPEVLNKLFTPFYRGNAGKEIPGSGLGLYICKKLVEKMGGEVRAGTNDAGDALFTFSLPVA